MMLRTVLNKFRTQHTTKYQLYGYLLPISQTMQVGWTRYTGPFWVYKDELISHALLWTPVHGYTSACWPWMTYKHQFCADTVWGLEDLLGGINDRDRWKKRVNLMLKVISTLRSSAYLSLFYILNAFNAWEWGHRKQKNINGQLDI